MAMGTVMELLLLLLGFKTLENQSIDLRDVTQVRSIVRDLLLKILELYLGNRNECQG